jgi:hypothetical protein
MVDESVSHDVAWAMRDEEAARRVGACARVVSRHRCLVAASPPDSNLYSYLGRTPLLLSTQLVALTRQHQFCSSWKL